MIEGSGRDSNLQRRVQFLRITSLLLCLPLRLRLLLFLELHFLMGGHSPLHSPLTPSPVFERYDGVDQQHKQCDDQKCCKSSWRVRAIFVRQLQTYPTLYDSKGHQEPAVPSMDIPYEQDLSMADGQTLVNNANERLESCQADQGCPQLRMCSIPIL